MNAQMQAILESKRRERTRLAALSFSEKIPLLEKLRDRALAIEDSALYRMREAHPNKAWVVRETASSSGSERKAFLGHPLGHKSHELLHTKYAPKKKV